MGSAKADHKEPEAGRPADHPALSVVLASVCERPQLEAVLGVILPACRDIGAEVIVARAESSAELTALTRAYPEVRFVAGSKGDSPSALKGLGLAQTTGDVVSLADDRSAAELDWSAALPLRSGIFGAKGDGVDWARVLRDLGIRDPNPAR